MNLMVRKMPTHAQPLVLSYIMRSVTFLRISTKQKIKQHQIAYKEAKYSHHTS